MASGSFRSFGYRLVSVIKIAQNAQIYDWLWFFTQFCLSLQYKRIITKHKNSSFGPTDEKICISDFRMSFIKIVSVIIIMLSWKENQWYGGENLLSTSESIPEIGKRPQIGWSGSCNRFIASSLCKMTILMKDTLCCNIALTWRKIHFNVFFLHKIWWSEVDC